MALTSNGDMYTQGTAFQQSSTAWTLRASSVSQISAWGVDDYFGGTYISDGTVRHIFAFTSQPYTDRAVPGLGGSFTKAFSADGTYLALNSAGEVFYWYKNNDNQGSETREATQLEGVQSVVDIDVWSYHRNDIRTYFGGGYVIEAVDCD